MQDFSQCMLLAFHSRELLLGKGSDADQLRGLEDLDRADEVFQASLLHRLHAIAWELIGRDVGPRVFHPDKGAEIGHEVMREEMVRRVKELRKEPPETTA